jgi:hypothetical protein
MSGFRRGRSLESREDGDDQDGPAIEYLASLCYAEVRGIYLYLGCDFRLAASSEGVRARVDDGFEDRLENGSARWPQLEVCILSFGRVAKQLVAVALAEDVRDLGSAWFDELRALATFDRSWTGPSAGPASKVEVLYERLERWTLILLEETLHLRSAVIMVAPSSQCVRVLRVARESCMTHESEHAALERACLPPQGSLFPPAELTRRAAASDFRQPSHAYFSSRSY